MGAQLDVLVRIEQMTLTAQFFDHLALTFERAASRYTRAFDVTIGTRRARLQFASDDLWNQFRPAFRHIEAPTSGEATLHIHAWEGGSVDTRPRAFWPPQAVGPRGEIQGFNTAPFSVAFNNHSRALSAADATSSRAFFWTPHIDQLAAYEKAAPFRTLLAWGAESWGGQLAHASAVIGESGAALVVGRGGVGKSTVALACWAAGLGYLADDYCALLPDDRGTTLASVYATAKLEENHLRAAWPTLAERAPPAWSTSHDKVILALDDDMYRKPASARLAAIVVPTIVARPDSELCSCSPAEALSALAPSSIFQTPRLGAAAFEFYARLVQRTPCFRLLAGSNLAGISEAMMRLLSRSSAPRSRSADSG